MEFDITFVEMTESQVMVAYLTPAGKEFVREYPHGLFFNQARFVQRQYVSDIYGKAKERNLRVARTNNRGYREAI
jgi:hypothetical protein